MPIRIKEGADPLSEVSRQSGSDSIVINAQSEAGRVLRQELARYCGREVNGRSFLVAGHRGAGKTTMVADAIDKVLRQSRLPTGSLMQPLPVFLHGPSLFEIDDASEFPALEETGSMADQARAALTQIILGLHRAVVKEFARAYRARVVEAQGFKGRPALQRAAFAELAAQFEVELVGDPTPARLREFWALAEALECGVLVDEGRHGDRLDPGSLELVALSGMCEAYQRISGEMSSQSKTLEALEQKIESSSGVSLKGAELVRPVVSVLAGVAVAGGTVGQTHSAGGALLAGIVAALGSSLMFSRSSTQTSTESRQVDTTFIPDLSLKTLDRILPTLLQRLRDAGLAPVLVIDELDKVERLSERLMAMIYFLKKLVAENVFTCFLTDRGYIEQLRLESRGAYSQSSSYFSHTLLVNFQPTDFDRYLDKLLRADTATSEGGDTDKLDLEVLKWVLRYRSELHALSLTREISLLRGEAGVVAMAPGVVRTQPSHLIAVTFQVAIELQLAQPNVTAWLRLHPERSQILIDALYFLSRSWAYGNRDFVWDERPVDFVRYLVERMNLDRQSRAEVLADIAGGSCDGVLLPDDLKLLRGIVGDMLSFLTQKTDEGEVRQRWADLLQGDWSWLTTPTLAVVQAMLLGDKSLLVAIEEAGKPLRYEWRYRPSGVLRDLPVVAAVGPALGPIGRLGKQLADELDSALQDVGRVQSMERVLIGLLQTGKQVPPNEQVFELLAERLRILPTSPAWQPVRLAIANLEHARNDPGRGFNFAEHARAVHSFVEMLEANAAALASALTMAGYLAGTGHATLKEQSDGLRHCAQLLSSGLRFDRLDGSGIVRVVDELNRQLEATPGVRTKAGAASAADADLGTLALAVSAAFLAGNAQMMQVTRQEKVDDAWEAAKARIERMSQGQEPGPVSADELLSAVMKAGPYRLLGLDFEAASLANWTTAVMLAAGITEGAISRSNEVPAWVIGHALNQLGSIWLDPGQLALFVGALLPARGLAGTEPLSLLAAAAGSSGDAGFRGGWALCVAGSSSSPMQAWRSRPRSGMVLVVTPEQADLLIEKGLHEVMNVPYAIARDGDLRSKALKSTPRYMGPAGQVPEVWVYRQREPAMKTPFIVDPQSPDEILQYATPRSDPVPGGSVPPRE